MDHIRDIESTLSTWPTIKKFFFQEEICPTTGTPHLQGCIWLSKKTRWEEFKFPFGNVMWWDAMRNEPASERYCTKEESKKEGGIRVSFGFKQKVLMVKPEDYPAYHLQWIKKHPNFVPRDIGHRMHNTYYDEMRAFYAQIITQPNFFRHNLGKMYFDDDVKWHRQMTEGLNELVEMTLS